MTDYPIGTVAKATVRGQENVRVQRCNGYTCEWVSAKKIDGDFLHNTGYVTDIRPLVVIDFEKLEYGPAYVRDIIRGLRLKGWHKLAGEIERQVSPPKPAEPKGLGAVVVTGDGTCYVHVGGGVWRTQTATCPYRDIPATEVLSQGIE